MTEMRRQHIIDFLNGRGVAAPVAFFRQQWPEWMRLRPSPEGARLQAMLQWLQQQPISCVRRQPQPAGRVGHWWALLTRQLNDAPPRDQRTSRWFAGFCTLFLHLGFAVMLVWVALVRSQVAGTQEEERTAVRFVSAGQGEGLGDGQGEPGKEIGSPAVAADKLGSGTPASASDEVASAQDVDAVVQPTAPVIPAAALSMELPMPVVEIVDAELVEHARAPDIQRPTPQMREMPSVSARELMVVERAIELVESPSIPVPELPPASTPPRPVDRMLSVSDAPVETAAVAPAFRPLPVPSVAVQHSAPAVTVVEKTVDPFIPESGPSVSMPAMSGRLRSPSGQRDVVLPATVAVPERTVEMHEPSPAVVVSERRREVVVPQAMAVATPNVRERDIAPRQAGEGAAASSMPGSLGINTPDRTGDVIAGPPSPEAAGSGAARAADARDGGRAVSAGRSAGEDWSVRSGDDQWSARAGNGGNDLFDAHGRARLPEAPAASRGAPGGEADGWTRERLAGAGTWLKRPPYEHRPTSFDQYWVPNESLLAEWVRKGVRNIAIPVPGTDTRIQCVISVLQLGGGCGLEGAVQPAQARAAPDIPFKPGLQQDNGSF